MKFFNTPVIKAIDAYTIEHEPVASIDLMERVARALSDAILERYAGREFTVFSGPGNNGGDGLAVARMLHGAGCSVAVWLINPKGKLSPDCAVNLERLQGLDVPVVHVQENFTMPSLPAETVIIDALFGSGLDRPVVGGIFGDVIRGIDACENDVVAIDMPSGLLGGDNDPALQLIVLATLTLTLQFPKLSQLFAENEMFVGELQILDIGLSQRAIDETPSPFFFTCKEDILPLMKPRAKHAHKGLYGRALLVAGSRGMAGASVLAARAALRCGVGLLTVHVPSCNNSIVQVAVPEAMTSIDSNECCFSDTIDTARYSAVAVGPGLGQSKESEAALLALIDNCEVPMVLDADALNILARNPKYMQCLPHGSIITPHIGEFTRLFGATDSSYVFSKGHIPWLLHRWGHSISTVPATREWQRAAVVMCSPAAYSRCLLRDLQHPMRRALRSIYMGWQVTSLPPKRDKLRLLQAMWLIACHARGVHLRRANDEAA